MVSRTRHRTAAPAQPAGVPDAPPPSARPGPLRPSAGARRVRRGLRGGPARPTFTRVVAKGLARALPAGPPGRPRRRAEHRRRRRHHDPGARRVPARGRRLRASAAGEYATGLVFLPDDEPPRRAPAGWSRSTRWSRAPTCSAGGTCRPTRVTWARPPWRRCPASGRSSSPRTASPTRPTGPAGSPLRGIELDRVAFCLRKQAERETAERGVPASSTRCWVSTRRTGRCERARGARG